MNPCPEVRNPLGGLPMHQLPTVTISSCSSLFFPSSSPFVTIHCRFGGTNGRCHYSDTWLFDVLTRKWTELQCTGYILSFHEDHAAALVDDVTYVLSGHGID